MKTLILALIFSSIASAQPAQPEVRLSDAEINNKLIGVARDIENERILEGIPDFQRCKQQFAFKAGETTADMRIRSAQDATKCFEDALKGKNSAQEIGLIADKLNLEAYKLIPSKSVQEITKYLSNKMYKSLTGIDYEENDVKKRIESLKFNKSKKIVDQKQFIVLYKNQIAKNVLTEVSRFCLEDFRIKTVSGSPAPSNDSFEAHWGTYLTSGNFQTAVSGINAPGVTDQGTPFNDFGAVSTSRDDKDTAYQKIIAGTFKKDIPDSQKLSAFFFFCGTQIDKLCSVLEGKVNTSGTTTATTGDGSRACLTKSRLVAYKQALKASDLIIADFDKNGGGNAFRLLDNPNEVVKAYGSGQDRSEKSLNEISNNASIDFFAATENEDTQRAQSCITGGGTDCDEFVIVDDSRGKIQYNVEIEYTAKREVEMARVRKLKAGDRQPLLEYLKTNGYIKLAESIESSGTIPSDIDEQIGRVWEAKKIALQEEIQKRLGKRQITENEAKAKANGTDENRVAYAKDNAKEALNERARLSRVIFFNNIISSNLNLLQSGKVIGRNTQALSGEVNALDGQVNASIFQNLRDSLPADTSGGGQNRGPTGREDVSDVSFLDQFLGGAPKPETGGQGQTQGGQGPND
jgi:hypothetical protein